MDLTWLDSNSWLWQIDGTRILVDPWLVGPLMFGQTPWFFKAQRPYDRPIPENIDLILLSQGLPDHTHPPTLSQCDRQIPVIGSVAAADIARSLGFSQVTALKPGENHTWNNINIQATLGSPVGPNRYENGYLLQGLTSKTTLYYEPHGYHDPQLQSPTTVDVVITPLVSITLPLLGAIIQGGVAALNLAQRLTPTYMIPTAGAGELEFSGWLTRLFQADGDLDQFQEQLQIAGLDTQVLQLNPWESRSLDPTPLRQP
ncbi:MBL fold metallo-hydrolase [Candidatus Synechococcus calcipolaris G9]|uniref:MBL fold metallo-hydrolase n=1 Tax=Candidatus Synechococcus calcipolaris G9 TaxID=1497997 RepID=A0ABT6EVA2_9SYNE|nr:MBL fold metallo-hydrolase [Candidatus Synechococcus calcipolaris]MDG2989740.1 MBL fold metallo-hydrolase [Candidatus Synechococcus calcipolaris G9]